MSCTARARGRGWTDLELLLPQLLKLGLLLLELHLLLLHLPAHAKRGNRAATNK